MVERHHNAGPSCYVLSRALVDWILHRCGFIIEPAEHAFACSVRFLSGGVCSPTCFQGGRALLLRPASLLRRGVVRVNAPRLQSHDPCHRIFNLHLLSLPCRLCFCPRAFAALRAARRVRICVGLVTHNGYERPDPGRRWICWKHDTHPRAGGKATSTDRRASATVATYRLPHVGGLILDFACRFLTFFRFIRACKPRFQR